MTNKVINKVLKKVELSKKHYLVGNILEYIEYIEEGGIKQKALLMHVAIY